MQVVNAIKDNPSAGEIYRACKTGQYRGREYSYVAIANLLLKYPPHITALVMTDAFFEGRFDIAKEITDALWAAFIVERDEIAGILAGES